MKSLSKLYCLFILLCLANFTFGQDVETHAKDHYSKTIFTTSKGKATIYFPNADGSKTISGTVVIDPTGRNYKQRQKNREQLQQLTLSLDQNSIPLHEGIFTLNTTNDIASISLKKGNKTIASTILSSEGRTVSCTSLCMPNYIVAGNPAAISSASFDGNACEDCVSLGGSPISILAESEHITILDIPEDLQGQQLLSITEDGTTHEQTVNVLQLSLSADQLSLRSGQQTQLSIIINGTEGLEEDITVNIINKSPQNIRLEGGNQQQLIISQNAGNSFQESLTINAISSGGFSISATIEPDELDEQQNDEPLCNCSIDGDLFLINPEACTDLGGQCTTSNNNPITASILSQNTHYDETVFHVALFSYDDDISGLEDDILDKWDEWDRAKARKKDAEEHHNELVAIDEILDKVPDTYKDDLKNAIDALEKVKQGLPEDYDSDTLQQAVADAEARVKTCEEHIKSLEKQRVALVKQLEEEKKAIEDLVEEIDEVLNDYGCKNGPCGASVTFEDGKATIDYNLPKDMNAGDEQLFEELLADFYKKSSSYRKGNKALKELSQAIEDAKDDCSTLNEALAKAKAAKAQADAVAAAELEVEDICEQIKRLLKKLQRWCKNNPDHCDFLKDIEALLSQCPKTEEELKGFWDDFDALLKKKKNLEDDFGKAAEDAQNDMDDIEDEVNDIKGAIQDLEDVKRKDQERKDQIAREKAAAAKAAADEAKARAAAAKKKKRARKKKDKEVKDLIKKIKSHDAADEVLKDYIKDLVISLGLDKLDDVSGDAKIGTLIGGLLTAKDIPDCACKLFKALKEALKAHNKGQDPFIYANEFIRHFKDCADLPHISSVMEGAQQLSEAIQSLTPEQTKQALEGITRVIRIQECK